MAEEQYSRKDILKWGVAGLVGATGLGFLVNALYKMDRVSAELGEEILTSTGKVANKKFIEGGRLNPMNDLNPLSDHDPKKQATKSDDEYRVTIQYEYRAVTIDNKDLYEQVEKGAEVIVQFREAFETRRTYKGELLERKLKEYKVEKILLNQNSTP